MKEQLKPCPFCGGKGKPSEGSFGPVNQSPVFEFHDITCEDCLAVVHGVNQLNALVKWNTRINPLDIPPKHGDIDALYEEPAK